MAFGSLDPLHKHNTQTEESTSDRGADADPDPRRWWGRRRREKRAMVHGARRAEIAFGRPSVAASRKRP
jgi:hypothetical protein